jgi:hypothetical protein
VNGRNEERKEEKENKERDVKNKVLFVRLDVELMYQCSSVGTTRT